LLPDSINDFRWVEIYIPGYTGFARVDLLSVDLTNPQLISVWIELQNQRMQVAISCAERRYRVTQSGAGGAVTNGSWEDIAPETPVEGIFNSACGQ
jgi:hypothetical protein